MALLFTLTGCGKSTRGQTEVPIYFTCDTQGRLEPCGCFVGQFGGLTRLKSFLDSTALTNAVRVDIGDSIGGREDYDLVQYRYMLRAFAEMKFDALNIGHREARLNAAQLKELKRSAPVPFLSANLLDKATGKPIFDSYRVIERGGYRIALVGVLDPAGLADPGEGVAVEAVEAALNRCLAEVRSRADLVVLLAFADEAALTQLAQQFYECNLILGGKVKQPAQELKRANRSLVYFVTNQARALGILRLGVADDAPLKVLSNQIVFLHDRIEQDRGFCALAGAYREEVRHARLAVDEPGNLSADRVPGVRAPATYVGSDSCVACHPSAAAVWEKSAHAQAFSPLVARRADADPKCIGCHTVGFGSASGYRREFGATKLVQVGCESCHGPGSLHVRQQQGEAGVEFTFRPLEAGDCKKCHYGEYSRPFDWSSFWAPIQHGREPEKTDKVNSPRTLRPKRQALLWSAPAEQPACGGLHDFQFHLSGDGALDPESLGATAVIQSGVALRLPPHSII